MKKIVLLSLVFFILFSFCACSKTQQTKKSFYEANTQNSGFIPQNDPSPSFIPQNAPSMFAKIPGEANVDYSGFSDIPENYTPQEAIEDGCLVFVSESEENKGLQIYGENQWYSFIENSNKGNPVCLDCLRNSYRR